MLCVDRCRRWSRQCRIVEFLLAFLDKAVQKTAEFPRWQYVDKVVDVPFVLFVVSSSRTKLLTCRCYADKVLIETVQQLVLLLDMVVDVPVLVTSWGCRGSAVAVHRQVCQLIMAMMSS